MYASELFNWGMTGIYCTKFVPIYVGGASIVRKTKCGIADDLNIVGSVIFETVAKY